MKLDSLRAVFDDERAVANAGLVLPATLGQRLGLEELVDETVDLSGRPGARPVHHRAALPGTSPRPPRRSRTCSPSCGARSSPRNTCQLGPATRHHKKSPRSRPHGPPPAYETAKVEIGR